MKQFKRLMNYDGYEIALGGVVRNTSSHKIMRHYDRGGYITVNLNGKAIPVKNLMAETFVPNPRALPKVMLLNGDKTCFDLGNICWCSLGELKRCCCNHTAWLAYEKTKSLTLSQHLELGWRNLGFLGFPHYRISNMGALEQLRYGQWVAKKVTVDNYSSTTLIDEDSGRHKVYIHRLVALAFLENPDNLPEVNHKNPDKQDNVWDNLEWCTPSGNMRHASDNDLLPTVLGRSDAALTKRLLDEGESVASIARRLSVPRYIVGNIKYGNSWKFV